MSSNFPQENHLVTISITSEGKVIPDTFQVQSVSVEKGVNQISSAKIAFFENLEDITQSNISSSSYFVPGNSIRIEAGYDSENQLLFSGIITKQSLQVQKTTGPVLVVECKDNAIKMAVGRKSRTFTNKKDSEIIETIIADYSSLVAKVTATSMMQPEQVQYYVSDWDFIRSRAEINGMVITTLNGEVEVFPPDRNVTSVMTVEYGKNLFEFNADLDSVHQLSSVTASSWDFHNQEVTSATVKSSVSGPGNLSANTLSHVIGLKDYELQTTAPLQSLDLTNWAKSEMLKSTYSKIQGIVKFQGNTSVEPGRVITLNGLGNRFNGNHFVSGVVHSIQEGNWITEAAIGLSAIWNAEEPTVMAPPASGLIPGVQGIFNGIVKSTSQDPDDQFRVLVDVPMFDPSGKGIWARLANFYATSNAGAFFFPEEGDEVVLGFLNEDPRYPIVLGSLYSKSKNLPFKELNPSKTNSKKAIVSKEGISIEFDDENKVFTIKTPSKNQAIFSDKDQKITIKDQNGGSVEMSPSGIMIKSAENITIESSQKLILKGETGVSIESSSGEVNVHGININNNANVKFSANAEVQAELKGGAQTTITGGMVTIN